MLSCVGTLNTKATAYAKLQKIFSSIFPKKRYLYWNKACTLSSNALVCAATSSVVVSGHIRATIGTLNKNCDNK